MSKFVVLWRFVRNRVASISPRVAILRLSVMLVAGVGLMFGGIPEVNAAYLVRCVGGEFATGIGMFLFDAGWTSGSACGFVIENGEKTEKEYAKEMKNKGYILIPSNSEQERPFNEAYNVSGCSFFRKDEPVSANAYWFSDRAICRDRPQWENDSPVVDGLRTISIVPGPTIKEGGTAAFTLKAVQAPEEPLSVAVTIDQTGNFVPSDGTGPKTVTIDTTGSGTLEVKTVVDAANATDGLITVFVLSGDKYTGSPSASVASVTVKKVTGPIPSEEEVVQEVVQETVAAVATATVSNVTSNIGARFSAPGTGGFSSPGTGGVLVRLAGMPVVFGSDDRNDPGSVSLADRLDAFGGDPWQPRQRTMSVDELLRTSSFEVTLGASEGESGDAPGAGSRITVWGRGDLQFFESGGGRKSGYDGHLVAGYLGADIAMDGGWLAGVAVSRIAAEADYTLAGAGEGGSLDADLTNIHPYVRVAVDDRNEAWAIFGLGRGKLTDAPDGNGQEKSKSDLSMRMASAGLRHRLATDMGIDLALLGDGSFATIETDDGVQSVAGISSDVWRARLGVEASHTSVWESGSSLTSFLEVAGRRDGGDATEGWGLEVSPGLSFSDPGSGLSVEGRIRALALHSVEDHDEYGASVTASLTPDADGLGLSMAVTPTWGAPETAPGEADANLFGRPAADRGRDALSLNSRVAYGLAAGSGVVSPFAELSLHRNDSQQMRIGSRYSLGSAVDLELFGARSGHGSGDPEHSVGLTSRVHF